MRVDDNGALVLHQSDIGAFVRCPDQFRVTNGILPGGDFEKVPEMRVETDAATVGTVTHAVIEHELTEGPFRTEAAALRWAKDYMGNLVFSYITGGFEYRTESFGENPDNALGKLAKLVSIWYRSNERKLWLNQQDQHPDSLVVEWEFDVPFIDNRDGRYTSVRLGGMADILDRYNHAVVDWKTTSRAYQRWEKQRWNVQPTVYTYAAAHLGLIDRHEDGYRFDYKVFNHKTNDTEPQSLTVWRDTGQWGWLVQMVDNMVTMIESDLEAWPLRDDHALCSPKWCPNWDGCKGTFVSHPDWA